MTALPSACRCQGTNVIGVSNAHAKYSLTTLRLLPKQKEFFPLTITHLHDKPPDTIGRFEEQVARDAIGLQVSAVVQGVRRTKATPAGAT